MKKFLLLSFVSFLFMMFHGMCEAYGADFSQGVFIRTELFGKFDDSKLSSISYENTVSLGYRATLKADVLSVDTMPKIIVNNVTKEIGAGIDIVFNYNF